MAQRKIICWKFSNKTRDLLEFLNDAHVSTVKNVTCNNRGRTRGKNRTHRAAQARDSGQRKGNRSHKHSRTLGTSTQRAFAKKTGAPSVDATITARLVADIAPARFLL